MYYNTAVILSVLFCSILVNLLAIVALSLIPLLCLGAFNCPPEINTVFKIELNEIEYVHCMPIVMYIYFSVQSQVVFLREG